MQIRKTYKEVNPELLYDEVKEFVSKQGAFIGEKKLETYSLPGGSSHVVRASLTFKVQGKQGEEECLRVHIVGSAAGETKMMLDINEALIAQDKVAALQEDLDFIFGSYETLPKK